jgi:hypothetical protein
MSSRFGVGDSGFRTERTSTRLADTVPFPAYTRAMLERAGPYDEELVRNQDDEYNFRIREMGGKILLAADVRSRYESRGTLPSLARQYFQYGWWKVRVMQKHPGQMSARHFAPALALLLAAALGIVATRVPTAAIVLAALAGIWLAGALAAALAASRGEPRLLPRVVAAYAILHVSYGLGFLAGLVRFAGRWGDRSTRGSSPPAERKEALP